MMIRLRGTIPGKMAYLKKEEIMFDRDEKGDLIPKDILLDLPGNPSIKLIPLTRGEIKKILQETKGGETSRQQENQIMVEHIVIPKLTIEEWDNVPIDYFNEINSALFKASRLLTNQDKFGSMASEAEMELKKK